MCQRASSTIGFEVINLLVQPDMGIYTNRKKETT